MSGNRRKNSNQRNNRTLPQETAPAHVVAIPKDIDPDPNEASLPLPEIDTRPVQQPEPESDIVPEPVVIRPAAKTDAKAQPRAKTERIGDMLREARLEHNGDLYQIAEYLCIKPSFLVALENSAYDKFQADAYVIGFLRTYANFLGLDGKDAVDRYRYEMAGRRKKPTLSMPTPLTEGRMPSGIIMVGVTIAILLIYALWYGISSANRTEVLTPMALPTSQQTVPDPSDAAAGLTAPVGTDSTAAPETAAPVPTTPVAPTATPAPGPGASNSVIIPPEAPGIIVSGLPQAMPAPSAKELMAEAAKDKDAMAAKESKSVKDAKAALEQAEKVAAAAEAAKASAKTEAKIEAPKADAPKVETPKVEVAKAVEPTPVPAKEAAKDEKKTADAVGRLVIRATQSSWVMVTDSNGKAVFDGVLKPGETYKVPDRNGLSLTTGNGSGIVLSLNGNDLPKIAAGAPRVVRNISLDTDRLTATQSIQ